MRPESFKVKKVIGVNSFAEEKEIDWGKVNFSIPGPLLASDVIMIGEEKYIIAPI